MFFPNNSKTFSLMSRWNGKLRFVSTLSGSIPLLVFFALEDTFSGFSPQGEKIWILEVEVRLEKQKQLELTVGERKIAQAGEKNRGFFSGWNMTQCFNVLRFVGFLCFVCGGWQMLPSGFFSLCSKFHIDFWCLEVGYSLLDKWKVVHGSFIATNLLSKRSPRLSNKPLAMQPEYVFLKWLGAVVNFG